MIKVQPAEPGASEIKKRYQHCEPLISASPIMYITQSADNSPSEPVTYNIPIPSNHTTNDANQKARPKTAMFRRDSPEECIHLMIRPGEADAWTELNVADMQQNRKGVVEVKLNQKPDR